MSSQNTENSTAFDPQNCRSPFLFEFSDGFRFFNLILGSIVLGIVLLTSVFWILWREKSQLRVRGVAPFLLLSISTVSICLSGPIKRYTYDEATVFNGCLVQTFIFWLGVPLFTVSQAIKLWLLRNRLKLNDYLVESFTLFSAYSPYLKKQRRPRAKSFAYATSKGSGSAKRNEFAKHEQRVIKGIVKSRYMMSHKFGSVMSAVSLFVSTLIPSILIFFMCPEFSEGRLCPQGPIGTVLKNLFFLMTIYSILYPLNKKMKQGFPDAYGIISEINVSMTFILCVSILHYILFFLDPFSVMKQDTKNFDWYLILEVGFFLIYCYQGPYRLLKIHDSDDLQVGTKTTTLADILSHGVGRKFFKRHLEGELSESNLDFYQASTEWFMSYHSTDREIREKVAKNIYSRWIKAGSRNEINISAKSREQVENGLAQVVFPHDMFNRARLDVYNLMESDSFRRFKDTAIFKVYTGVETKPNELATGIIDSGDSYTGDVTMYSKTGNGTMIKLDISEKHESL